MRIPGANMLADLRAASQAQLDEVRIANLRETLDLAARGHRVYGPVIVAAGLDRGRVTRLEDLRRLPVSGKSDFAADPEAYRLQVDDGPLEWRIDWDIMYTTGSTGKPAPFHSTTYDYYNALTVAQRMLEIREVDGRDIIANLNPMTVQPTGAFMRTLHAASTIGAPIVSALPGNPSPYFRQGRRLDEVVRLIERTRATVLWGITSYVRRVIARALELRADFSRVRRVFVTGEAAAPGMRDAVHAELLALGAQDPFVSLSYGQTETQAGMVECRPDGGMHNPAPELFFWEIVDPQTGAPLPDGQEGLVLLTHLDRRGTLLLRYALGDISAITTERCPHCGRIGERFVCTPRRADRRVKIKGMLVDLASLEECLRAATAKFRVRIERSVPTDATSADLLRVTLPVGAGDDDTRIAAAVKAATGVTPVVDRGDIEAPADDAGKQRWFFDLR